MSNKARRDELKRRARIHIKRGMPDETLPDAVLAMVERIDATEMRLSIQRAIHREERSRRSIARRAQQTRNERLAEALLA